MAKRTCSIEGCEKPVVGRGWCGMHYARMRRHGTLAARGYGPRPRPLAERFWAKVEKDGPVPTYAPHLGPCWLWTGGADTRGYGNFTPSHGVHLKAYRWSWTERNGPIPGDLVIDHLCRVPRCVNPAHLEPVTRRENTVRATMLITHCPQGHPYNEKNTYVFRGARRCRACHSAQVIRAKQAKRARR